MTKDEICGLLRQIHDVLAMQSETNHWAKPTPAEYAMGYAEGFNDACKPKQGEPVAWELRKGKTDRVLIEITNNPERAHNWKASLAEVVPLYTTPPPPQRTWVGLTDEEVKDIVWNLPYEPSQEHIRAIEAKLKEKNNEQTQNRNHPRPPQSSGQSYA